MLIIQRHRDIRPALTLVQRTVTFNVTRCAIDQVRHALPRVGVERRVVHDGGSVNGPVHTQRVQSFVPVNVARNVHVHPVLEQDILPCRADVGLVARCLRAVHGPVAHGDDPRRLGAIDRLEVLDEPLVLFICRVVVDAVAVNLAKGTGIRHKSLVLERMRLVGVGPFRDFPGKGPLGGVGKVGLAVERDEVGQTIVERVPEIADTAALGTGRTESVLESCKVAGKMLAPSSRLLSRSGEDLPLRGRAAVVRQVGGRVRRVWFVQVQPRRQRVVRPIVLGAAGLVVTGQNHVRQLETDIVHPLLPQIPVGLIDDAHVPSERTALVGFFTSWERCVVALWVVTRGQLTVGSIVADRPVVFARQHTIVPVVSVGDVATVPNKVDRVVEGGIKEVFVCPVGVGVPHVVDDGHAEGFGGASGGRRFEGEHI